MSSFARRSVQLKWRQTIPYLPVHVEPDKVWLDRPLPQAAASASQQVHVASLPELFRAFGEAWADRWLRHAHVSWIAGAEPSKPLIRCSARENHCHTSRSLNSNGVRRREPKSPPQHRAPMGLVGWTSCCRRTFWNTSWKSALRRKGQASGPSPR